MTLNYLHRIWEASKGSRLGQFLCIAGIIFAMFFVGFLKSLADPQHLQRNSLAEEARMFLAIWVSLTIVVTLVLLVPSMWREHIEKKQARGERITGLKILFWLYCFPFLPILLITFLALVTGQFDLLR